MVKIKYSSHSKTYEYVCLRSLKPKKGDFACVTTGSSDVQLDSLRMVQITAVSTQVEHLSSEFELSPVVNIISTQKYNKVIKAKGAK